MDGDGGGVQSDTSEDPDDCKGSRRMETVKAKFNIEKNKVLEYWNKNQNSNQEMKERRFNTTRVGFDMFVPVFAHLTGLVAMSIT